MKRIYFLSLFLILTLTVISLNFFIGNEDLRTKQEAFILKSGQEFTQKLSNIDTENKAADQPDMAAFQEFISTLDPKLGYVPDNRLLEAYKETRQIYAEQNSNRNYDPILEWETSGSNMGGRTRALMFDPSDDEKVWAGGVTGGLWYNDDITSAQTAWQAVNDFWPNLAVSCITYDPNNTDIMYVGTGEAQTARIIYRKSSGVGAGIYKTIDAGDTWELIPSTEDFAYVTDVVVKDENGTSVIFAAVVSGNYMGEEHESMPSDGLYRSDDEGETWTQVLPEIPGDGDQNPFAPSDIEIATDGRIFVGTMENLDLKGGACVLYSDSGLEGSWTIYADYNTVISNENYYNIPARTIVAVAPSNSNKVYAQFAAGYDNGFTYYRGRYMVKSADGGETWDQINTPSTNNWSTLAWHAFILQVDPNNEDLIFTGGLDLWKSSSAGQSWRHVSDWALMYYGGGNEYVHADQHNIQFRPGHENEAVFSSDGGVFYSSTTNLTDPIFKERNKSYSTLQYYSAAINPTAGSDKYIGGLQDNGTLLHSGSPLDINDMIDGGDGALCFWDKNQPEIFITSVYYNAYTAWYNESQTSSISGNSGTFICPADYDYKLNVLYANGTEFSGNYADRILKVTGIPYDMNNQLVYAGTSSTVPFSHVKYSELSDLGSSTIFVGNQVGRLFKIKNIHAIPITTEIGSPDFPIASLSCVDIGQSEDTLLVTFSNYGVSSVWQTYDGGDTWQEKEANLPDMPIRWALYHPDNSGQALLATETGIWATNTLMEEDTEWQPAVDNMANVRVDMLTFRDSDNTVLAATHGRGLFTATYNVDLYTDMEEKMAVSQVKVYPNPATDHINFELYNIDNSNISIQLFDVSGRLVKESSTSTNKCRMNLSDLQSGTYIASVSINDKVFEKKSIILN